MLIRPEIQAALIIVLGMCVVAISVLALALRNQRRRNRSVRRRFRDLEGEEQRMFSFLHDLGLAIENEPSPVRALAHHCGRHRQGGERPWRSGLFAQRRKPYLLPSYISEDCPPLVGIPVEVRRKAARDPRALGKPHPAFPRGGR